MAENSPESQIPAAPAPKEHKPVGVTPRTAAAIREVLARDSAGLRPCYKDVARRHGISWRALKTACSKARNGELNLGLPEDITQLELDAGVELQRTLRLLLELESLANDTLEGLINQARHFTTRGKLLAYRDLGVPLVISDLRSIAALRRIKEEGYMAILEKVTKEKQLRSPVADINAEVIRADPATANLRAAEALRRAAETPAETATGAAA